MSSSAHTAIATAPRPCLHAVSDRKIGRALSLATLAAAAILGGCHRPVSDPARLRALEAAATALRRAYPVDAVRHHREVPRRAWPAAVAAFHPDRVVVHQWGVDVRVKAYFDGGWGYHIARQRRDLPMPDGCYSEVQPRVFWHGPC